MTAAILLAAGESRRMGRPKALLPWRGGTLLEYQVAELRAAGIDDVVVVLGNLADAIVDTTPRGALVAVNTGYKEGGPASSLRWGARCLAESTDPIVILGVDQPRPRRVHERLLSAHRAARALITVPTADGRRGHPIVLAGSLLPELRKASEKKLGLRGIIAAHEAEVQELAFILLQHESMASEPDLTALMVRIDINTPQEYEDARTLFGS